MQVYTSFDPSTTESHEENHKGHMVKHVSRHLRQLIMNTADGFALHNLVVYHYQSKKKNEGKHWRIVQSHVA